MRGRRSPAVVTLLAFAACAAPGEPSRPPPRIVEILLTSQSGHRLTSVEVVPFRPGRADGPVVSIEPDSTKQTIDGIGTSFTEASAFVLAHLDPNRRREVMRKIFGESGADFTLARTHIASCDFTVNGKYSYAETPGDEGLMSFTIAPDMAGFDPEVYPGIKDRTYDLLPMIREALEVKRGQDDGELRIIASAWTAPPWMKNIETWYVPASSENDWQGDGGWLKPEYVPTYADYLLKYLDAYRRAGVEIWGLTPVNEPHGNGGNWESMHFSPASQNDFVQNHLGPRLRASGHETRILIYDQNPDGLEDWTDVILADPRSADHVYGAAVHWYASTFKVYGDVFDRVHARFPEFAIVHTEGCIDSLGVDAPRGVRDPLGFKESGWFKNDAFWWHDNATDWAYSATWAAAEDHPKYTPVHRYARDIIAGLNHWVSGWIDWNIVLDKGGGPNHVGNFCGAPIMIDTETQEVYYTPIYYVLAQFSRTIRPGDKAVRTRREFGSLKPDALHASATIHADGLVSVQVLNTTQEPIDYALQLAEHVAEITIPANSLQTVRVQR